MTRLLVSITNPAQAEQVSASDVDIVDVSGADRTLQESMISVLRGRVQIVASEDGAGVDYVSGNNVPGKSVVPVGAETFDPALQLNKVKTQGARAVVLTPAEGQSFFSVVGPDVVSAFVTGCHELGLEAWIGGRLEPPDVPRLIEHGPDVICTDILASEQFRTLMTPKEPSGRPHDHPMDGLEGDHVIVRDLILPVQVGAYGFEKERAQRVCFNVDAEVRRRSDDPEDMRDVFSYDIILDGIRALVAGGHTILVETLAERTAQKILKHPDVVSVRVRVEKLDLGPAAVGVEITRRRKECRDSHFVMSPGVSGSHGSTRL